MIGQCMMRVTSLVNEVQDIDSVVGRFVHSGVATWKTRSVMILSSNFYMVENDVPIRHRLIILFRRLAWLCFVFLRLRMPRPSVLKRKRQVKLRNNNPPPTQKISPSIFRGVVRYLISRATPTSASDIPHFALPPRHLPPLVDVPEKKTATDESQKRRRIHQLPGAELGQWVSRDYPYHLCGR